MIKFLGLFYVCVLSSCSNYGQLTFICRLPDKLNENSGIAILDSTSVWFIEDGGNDDRIYQVSFEGEIKQDFEVKNAKNKDWEDLASDPEGNIYIADFGNNSGKRESLVIYKIPDPRIEGGDKIDAQKINYRYPDRKRDDSGEKKHIHDAEALFYSKGFLYIITKDRSRPFTGEACIYKVPAEKGSYTATMVGSFTPCTQRGVCEVTAADISPDGKRIALLGYSKLWVFSDFDTDDFTRGKVETIDLGATTQLESVGFLNKNTLLLSDEKHGLTGCNLYKYFLD